jgi:hypothetical protein
VIRLVKAGGPATAALATASWGWWTLPRSSGFPKPYDTLAPMISFAAMSSGALGACVTVLRGALGGAAGRTGKQRSHGAIGERARRSVSD